MRNQPRTVPSLSGTFGIHTRLALNPKMPKEPSSPSRTTTMTKKHCSKIETFRLKEENSRHITLSKFHLHVILFALVLLTSCQSNNMYHLRGQISGEFDESWVYLVKFYSAQPQVDSAEVRNGKFAFTGTIAYPELFVLHNHPDSILGFFPIYLETGKLVVSIDPENWSWGSQIEGGKTNDEYNLEFRLREQSLINITEELEQSKVDADSTKLEEIDQKITDLMESNKVQDIQFIKSHPNSPISPYILAKHFFGLSLNEVGLLLDSFSSDLHKISIYIKLKENYDRMRDYENQNITG